MELLWARDEPQSVADVHALLSRERELAYTTVMTVLDRLSKKGLVERQLVSRAWQYRAASSQAEVIAREMLGLLKVARPDVQEAAVAELVRSLTPEQRRALADTAKAG